MMLCERVSSRVVTVPHTTSCQVRRVRLKCDGTRAEIRLRLSAKRTSPFKSPEASVQSTTGCRGVRISGSNAGYTMFRGSVKSTGYPLHSPVSPSLTLPCVTVCHHILPVLHHPCLPFTCIIIYRQSFCSYVCWYVSELLAVSNGKTKVLERKLEAAMET